MYINCLQQNVYMHMSFMNDWIWCVHICPAHHWPPEYNTTKILINFSVQFDMEFCFTIGKYVYALVVPLMVCSCRKRRQLCQMTMAKTLPVYRPFREGTRVLRLVAYSSMQCTSPDLHNMYTNIHTCILILNTSTSCHHTMLCT